MSNCINCNKETVNPKFCSNSCAAKYNNKNRKVSNETKLKISASLKLKASTSEKKTLDPERLKKFQEANLKWRKEQEQKMLVDDFETLSLERQRKRIIIEQNGTCYSCNLSEWLGKPIPLEIDHIDGNHSNDVRENKVALCPNCHAQTDTWRGRNKGNRRNEVVSDDEVVEAYLKYGTIRQALIAVGLAAKGANYGRVKRALTMRGIEYKNDTDEK